MLQKSSFDSVVYNLVIVGFVCTLICSATVCAQQTTPLPVADSLKTFSFGDVSRLAFSPDGSIIAYMVRDNYRIPNQKVLNENDLYLQTGILAENQGGDLWLSDIRTGKTRNLTGGKGSNWQPTWSPDGRLLAFLSNRDGKGEAKLWVWEKSSNVLRRVSEVPIRAFAANELEWSSDSRKILVPTAPQRFRSHHNVGESAHPGPAGTRSEIASDSTVILYRSGLAESASPTVGSANPLKDDAPYLHDLEFIDVRTGGSTVLVRDKPITWYTLSPSENELAYAVPFDNDLKMARARCDLMIVDLRTMQETRVASHVVLGTFSWSPDGKLLAYGAFSSDKEYDYFLVAAAGGEVRKVSSLAPKRTCCLPAQMPMWQEDGRYFYFVSDGALWRASVSEGKSTEFARIPNRRITFRIAQSGNLLWRAGNGGNSLIVIVHDDSQIQDGFYSIDLGSGRSTKLLEAGECYSCKWPATDIGSYLTTVSPKAQSLAYIAESPRHPPDLWVSDALLEHRRRLTHLNPQFDKYTMGSVRLVQWQSEDARLVGAVLLPSDYQPGRRYPLVVWVYPGGALSNGADQFGMGTFPGPNNAQLLATRGYAVFFPDARETTGDRIGGIARSVLPGIEKLVELGIADPARMAVIGHSQGGYAALALITQSTEFRAAIAMEGWGDYFSYYGIMRNGLGPRVSQAERQLGGPPWQDPTTYIQNSPILLFNKVETPLLLVHSTGDLDLPPALGDEVFVALQRMGKPVEYARYEGGSHVPRDWSYANQLDLDNRVLGWLEKYVQGGAAR